MHLDVQDLKSFYYRTNLGRVAQRAIRAQMAEFWSSWKGETVVGFGFAVPLLRPYMADARRVVGLMPGPQGVMHWPAGVPNMAVLCEETLWPLQSGQADKLIVMHGPQFLAGAAFGGSVRDPQRKALLAESRGDDGEFRAQSVGAFCRGRGDGGGHQAGLCATAKGALDQGAQAAAGAGGRSGGCCGAVAARAAQEPGRRLSSYNRSQGRGAHVRLA